MNFRDLAVCLEKLEGTSSRLEMTKILARLFWDVTPAEGKIIAYLVQGMLGPEYDNPDVGMAEKQVIKSIARLSDGDVGKIYKDEGDLGKAAEKIKAQIAGHKPYPEIDIIDVYKRLLDIAGASGAGSQEEKIGKLGDLISELDPLSSKYAVKIVLGKLRGGFSDMTILDALSWMISGDKSLRKGIERIYNVRADLGEVVKRVKEAGSEKAVRNLSVEPKIGMPVLVARGEREKTIRDIWERMKPVAAAEHKLDGLRIEAHVEKSGVNLFSRGLENVTVIYPDIVEGLKKQIKKECILDGEMLGVGADGKYLPFQETVQRKRKYDVLKMMEKVPLKYYVFDVLFSEGKSYIDQPNEKRWSELERIFTGGQSKDTIRLIPRRLVKSEKEMEIFFREALAAGAEGMFIKKLDAVYQSGSRDFNWIKYKKSYIQTGEADTIDAVVMGYDAGLGKRSGFGIGGFLIGVYEKKKDVFSTIAKIGTGLSDEEWRELKIRCDKIRVSAKPGNFRVNKQMDCDVWVKPMMVVEVKCDEITRSPVHTAGFALRFPRLVSFRETKVEEAASPSEIRRLFDLQTQKRKGGGNDD